MELVILLSIYVMIMYIALKDYKTDSHDGKF